MENFKQLKDSITKNLFESIVKNEKNREFKKFLTEVKKSPILKLQMEVYDNLENGKAVNIYEASFFLEQNMKQFNVYTQEEIKNANQKLMESFGSTLGSNDTIFKLIMESAKDAKVKAGTFTLWSEITTSLMENGLISEAAIAEVSPALPMKKVIKRATEILNEKYSFLNETELKIVKSFLHKDEETKENLYKELVAENLKLVKRKLFESDGEGELNYKLEQITEKLNSFKYTSGTEIKEFSQLIDLQNTLR